MHFENLQTALQYAEKLDTIPASVALIELHRIDETRGFRDQAEIDYWTDRLNNLES